MPKKSASPVRQILADTYNFQLDRNPETIVQILHYIPFLEGLSSDKLKELAKLCKMIEFEADKDVIQQGEDGDKLYIVLKGKLRVFQNIEGEKRVLGELKRNQIFGESVILEKGIRTATVTTIEKSLLVYLTTDNFNSFLNDNPDLRNGILNLARKRIDWAERQFQRPSMELLMNELGKITGATNIQSTIELEKEIDWFTLAKDLPLIKTGDLDENIFFVLNGSLDVFLIRDDGSRVRLGKIKKGEMVGEMALITKSPRSADVYASENSELLKLSKAGYEILISTYPETLKSFSQILASRLLVQLQSKTSSISISSMPIPSDAECLEIVNNPDMVLRNLQITQMYHRLSVQLSNILGQSDANWCTFATHASKTAGYSIRREELPGYSFLVWLEDSITFFDGISSRLDKAFNFMAQRFGIAAKSDQIIDHVSNCIAAGNLKVFSELAPLFAEYLRTFQDHQNSDLGALENLFERLDPGHTAAGGQQLVKEAFTYYFEAMMETDQKRKAEFLLSGNILIGLHEQTRLQPYIVEALNSPITDFLDPNRKHISLDAIESKSVYEHSLRTRLLLKLVQRWRKILTRYMMKLRLPYGDISLGRDLPKLPNRRAFPDVLYKIESPQLKELLDRFDKSKGKNLKNSRSMDWGNLDDRMNFIINLFRSRHKSLELFDQPFFYEQRIAMQNSMIPEGRL